MQEDHVGQGSSKKARTYVKYQKEVEPTCSKYLNRFISDSESSDTENTCHQGLCWQWKGIRGPQWWYCEPTWSETSR